MANLLKWLAILALVVGLLTAASYLGARATAGGLLGPNPPVGSRSIDFAFGGVATLRGNPRAWVFTYRSSQLPGVSGVRVYVSPTGKLIATDPPDLQRRLEAYERAREP